MQRDHSIWAGRRAALMQLIAERLRQQATLDGDDDGSLEYYATALDQMAASLIVGVDLMSAPGNADDHLSGNHSIH